MDYAKLELDASRKGWVCSECGLFSDCLGRPIFNNTLWFIETKSMNWLENKPSYSFCPKCGKPIRRNEDG